MSAVNVDLEKYQGPDRWLVRQLSRLERTTDTQVTALGWLQGWQERNPQQFARSYAAQHVLATSTLNSQLTAGLRQQTQGMIDRLVESNTYRSVLAWRLMLSRWANPVAINEATLAMYFDQTDVLHALLMESSERVVSWNEVATVTGCKYGFVPNNQPLWQNGCLLALPDSDLLYRDGLAANILTHYPQDGKAQRVIVQTLLYWAKQEQLSLRLWRVLRDNVQRLWPSLISVLENKYYRWDDHLNRAALTRLMNVTWYGVAEAATGDQAACANNLLRQTGNARTGVSNLYVCALDEQLLGDPRQVTPENRPASREDQTYGQLILPLADDAKAQADYLMLDNRHREQAMIDYLASADATVVEACWRKAVVDSHNMSAERLRALNRPDIFAADPRLYQQLISRAFPQEGSPKAYAVWLFHDYLADERVEQYLRQCLTNPRHLLNGQGDEDCRRWLMKYIIDNRLPLGAEETFIQLAGYSTSSNVNWHGEQTPDRRPLALDVWWQAGWRPVAADLGDAQSTFGCQVVNLLLPLANGTFGRVLGYDDPGSFGPSRALGPDEPETCALILDTLLGTDWGPMRALYALAATAGAEKNPTAFLNRTLRSLVRQSKPHRHQARTVAALSHIIWQTGHPEVVHLHNWVLSDRRRLELVRRQLNRDDDWAGVLRNHAPFASTVFDQPIVDVFFRAYGDNAKQNKRNPWYLISPKTVRDWFVTEQDKRRLLGWLSQPSLWDDPCISNVQRLDGMGSWVDWVQTFGFQTEPRIRRMLARLQLNALALTDASLIEQIGALL